MRNIMLYLTVLLNIVSSATAGNIKTYKFDWDQIVWPYKTTGSIDYAAGTGNLVFNWDPAQFLLGTPKHESHDYGNGQEKVLAMRNYLPVINQSHDLEFLFEETNVNGLSFNLHDIDRQNDVIVQAYNLNGNPVPLLIQHTGSGSPSFFINGNSASGIASIFDSYPGQSKGNAKITIQGAVHRIVISIITDLGNDYIGLGDIEYQMVVPAPTSAYNYELDWEQTNYLPGATTANYQLLSSTNNTVVNLQLKSISGTSQLTPGFPDDLKTLGNIGGFGDGETLIFDQEQSSGSSQAFVQQMSFDRDVSQLHFAIGSIDNFVGYWGGVYTTYSIDDIFILGTNANGAYIEPEYHSEVAGATFHYVKDGNTRRVQGFGDRSDKNYSRQAKRGTLNVFFNEPVKTVVIYFGNAQYTSGYSKREIGLGDIRFVYKTIKIDKPIDWPRFGDSGNDRELGISVSPNPAKDYIQVEWPDPELSYASTNGQLEIFSIQGQRWKQANLAAGERRRSVSVTSLPPGTYIIRVKQGEKKWTQKFIKN